MEQVVSTATLSVLALQLLKYLIRYWKGSSTLDFSREFYLVAIPVLNVLMIPVAAMMGIDTVSMPTDWYAFSRLVMTTLVASLGSVMAYTQAYKPLNEYRKE